MFELRFFRLFIPTLLTLLSAGGGVWADISIVPDEHSGQNLVTGHYGETFLVPRSWKVNYSMVGDLEFIWLHEKWKKGPDGNLVDYKPLPQYYENKNYTPMGLASIQVIPKSSMKDFSTLEEAEKLELRIIKETFKGEEDLIVFDPHLVMGFWPPGSFGIRLRKPYELMKIYTQSKDYFFILTGAKSDKEKLLSSDVQWIFHSLASRLYDKYPRPTPDPNPYPLLGQFLMVVPVILVWVGAFLLTLLPRDPFGRLVLLGRSVMALFFIWGALGFVAALVCVRIFGIDVYGGAVFAFPPIFFMPWLLRKASDRLGGEHPGRVFWVNILLIPFFSYWAIVLQYFLMPALIQIPEGSLFMSIWLGVVYGIIFALTLSPLPEDLGWKNLWEKLRSS